MLLVPASATAHLGIYAIVVIFGFIVGVTGHITQNRTLVITGIIVIGAVSIYFAAAGEVQSFPR